VFSMNPGHEIREKHAEKVELVRRHLNEAFGGGLPESEEFRTDCLLFRTPSLASSSCPMKYSTTSLPIRSKVC
jgi:hypothetical protein